MEQADTYLLSNVAKAIPRQLALLHSFESTQQQSIRHG